MKIYYDYELIYLKLNDSEEYISEFKFTINSDNQVNIPFKLKPEDLNLNNNIHKLLVTFTTGYDQNASDFERTTNDYSLNYNQTNIDDELFRLIKLDGTSNGKITFKAPMELGKYEVIGYVILNPFTRLSNPDNLVHTSYRFTLLVD